jgi:hypothetical protein
LSTCYCIYFASSNIKQSLAQSRHWINSWWKKGAERKGNPTAGLGCSSVAECSPSARKPTIENPDLLVPSGQEVRLQIRSDVI